MSADRINCDLSFGYLTVDGQSLHTYAWCATDLSSLWSSPEIRGADKLLGGVNGVRPYRRRRTATVHSFPFAVTGRCDPAGTLHDDPFTGLETNVAYLLTYVVLPTGTGDGTRVLTWTRPSGATTTADVHVLALKLTTHPGGIALGTLEVSDPTGSLHP